MIFKSLNTTIDLIPLFECPIRAIFMSCLLNEILFTQLRDKIIVNKNCINQLAKIMVFILYFFENTSSYNYLNVSKHNFFYLWKAVVVFVKVEKIVDWREVVFFISNLYTYLGNYK
ncbi:hypothetical protein BpHYR1_010443 [Brachionus plicatilis]|uniref:Uncharacterized protein n=1 Tax=Brachionus plicatilis TaxID=10195 RepID=A0A3M7S0J1_BRAPC|nr:hypothetical protein BpHYR1_010443 [Brachionus plicatilis]